MIQILIPNLVSIYLLFCSCSSDDNDANENKKKIHGSNLFFNMVKTAKEDITSYSSPK